MFLTRLNDKNVIMDTQFCRKNSILKIYDLLIIYKLFMIC